MEAKTLAENSCYSLFLPLRSSSYFFCFQIYQYLFAWYFEQFCVHMDVLHSTLTSPNVAEGRWRMGRRAKSALCGCFERMQRPSSSFPMCELNVAGSLTSVKPMTTVSVCSLALLQRQAQTRFIARSILLPDFNFAWNKKKVDIKRWIMNHWDDLCISILDGKQAGGRGGSPLSLYFVYQVHVSVAYFFI